MKAFFALVILTIVVSTHADPYWRAVKDKVDGHILDSKCDFSQAFIDAKVTVPEEFKIDYETINAERAAVGPLLNSANVNVKKAVEQFFGLIDDINSVGFEHILAIDEFLQWGDDQKITDFLSDEQVKEIRDSLDIDKFKMSLSIARFRPNIKYSEASVLRAAERVERLLETLLEVEFYHVSIMVPAIDTDISHVLDSPIGPFSGCFFKKDGKGKLIPAKESDSGKKLPNCSFDAIMMFRNIHEHLDKVFTTYLSDHAHAQAGAKELFQNLLDIFSTGEVLVEWDVEEEFAASRYTLYDELHQVTRFLDGFMEIIEEALEKLRQTGIAGFSIMEVVAASGTTPLSMRLETTKTEIAAAEKKQDMDNDLRLLAALPRSLLFINVVKPKDSTVAGFHAGKALLHTTFKGTGPYKTYQSQNHTGAAPHTPTHDTVKHGKHVGASRTRKATHVKTK